jgi:hypothetical protein
MVAQWWFWEDWLREPEVRQYLDLITMLKMVQERSAIENARLGYGTRDFQPAWLPPQSGKKKSSKVNLMVCWRYQIEIGSSEGLTDWNYPDDELQTSLSRTMRDCFMDGEVLEKLRQEENLKKRYNEDIEPMVEADVLNKTSMQTFSNAFSPEEAERFFVFLVAPSLAPSAMLSWFEGQRVINFQNEEIFRLIERAIFEPGPFTSSLKQPRSAPVQPSRRRQELALTQGRLCLHLGSFLRSVLTPLHKLCQSASDMSAASADFKSPFLLLMEKVRGAPRFRPQGLFTSPCKRQPYENET